jgi:hypothetical protein
MLGRNFDVTIGRAACEAELQICPIDNLSARATQKTQPLCCYRGVFTVATVAARTTESTALVLLREYMSRA